MEGDPDFRHAVVAGGGGPLDADGVDLVLRQEGLGGGGGGGVEEGLVRRWRGGGRRKGREGEWRMGEKVNIFNLFKYFSFFHCDYV